MNKAQLIEFLNSLPDDAGVRTGDLTILAPEVSYYPRDNSEAKSVVVSDTCTLQIEVTIDKRVAYTKINGFLIKEDR